MSARDWPQVRFSERRAFSLGVSARGGEGSVSGDTHDQPFHTAASGWPSLNPGRPLTRRHGCLNVREREPQERSVVTQ